MKKTLAIFAIALCSTAAFAQEDDSAPQPIPNHIKYQDSKPNAKATGAIAVVETRALLSADGQAHLEVTTGDLDTGTPSTTANISKVQLEVGGGSVTNYNHLNDGGTFTLPLGNVAQHTPFSAQVNVKGLNDGRTEVVQVNDMVRLRPDLHIASVSAPGAVRPGQPFTIVAEIREMNGDTGARTDCVLENQQGERLDVAENIWVDAGDSVPCTFSQTVSATGKNAFYVKLVGTRPMDWSYFPELSGFIVLGAIDKEWELNATQKVLRHTYNETASDDPEHPRSGENVSTTDNMRFSAAIDQPIDLNSIQMSIEEKTDDKTIVSYPAVGGFPPISSEENCRLSDRRSSVYTVCRFGNGLALDVVSVGANTVYRSHFWTVRFDPASGQNVYTRRTLTTTSKFGPLQRYGSTYSLRISLSDANGNFWEASPFVNLVPYEEPVVSKTTYREYAGVTYRTDSTDQEYGKRGSASQD